jgi:hypothetical protein
MIASTLGRDTRRDAELESFGAMPALRGGSTILLAIHHVDTRDPCVVGENNLKQQVKTP